MPRASSLCGECLRSVGADLLGPVAERAPELYDDCARAVVDLDRDERARMRRIGRAVIL
jgi:hypothetical protein